MTPLARTEETTRAPVPLLRADAFDTGAVRFDTPANDTGADKPRSILERRRRRTARRDARL